MEAGRVVRLTDGTVVLDRFREDDEDAHLEGEDDEQARRFGWWPRRSGPRQFRRMLEQDEDAWLAGGPRLRFAVRVSGVLVGGCELRVRGGGLGHVSYWTFPAHRRHGYGTRALRLLSQWALRDLSMARLEAHIEKDNHGSVAVAQRAGFETAARSTGEGLLVYEARP